MDSFTKEVLNKEVRRRTELTNCKTQIRQFGGQESAKVVLTDLKRDGMKTSGRLIWKKLDEGYYGH